MTDEQKSEIYTAAQLAKRRADLLLATKAERKKLGIASATKKAVTDALMIDAAKLAIAEQIMAGPYGRDVKLQYESRCAEVIIDQEAAGVE